MGNQVSDEPAGRFELLPRLGDQRVDEVLAQ